MQDIHDEVGGLTFMVFNLAPIGCYPSFLTELPHNSSDLDIYGCMISYNAAVVEYNSLLNETLQTMRNMLTGASIIYVDTHSVKLELFRRPRNHGQIFLVIELHVHGLIVLAQFVNFQGFCMEPKLAAGMAAALTTSTRS